MEPDQLDQEVADTLAALQEAGEPITAEGVRSRVGRRMSDVLAAIHRVAGMSPPEPDVDLPAELYPEVVSAQAKVDRLIQALAEAEQGLRDAEAAYAAAELQAAEATVEGQTPPSLVASREAMSTAAEQAHLLARALNVAKARYDDALAEAQAQHWAAQWRRYQDAIAAFDAALRQAYALQEHCREIWNQIGQPGEVPLLKGPLSVWEPHFHGFLQEILDMPAEAVRRGSLFAP